MWIVGTQADTEIFKELDAINRAQKLALNLQWHTLPKISQKLLMDFALDKPFFIAIIKGVPTLIYCIDDELIKISPNWQSLTKRIVTAGRKSELLLQACKLVADMTVIDATAGFGHDALILASTGANVLMIEKTPVMALLLFYEHWLMNQHKNWQKLLQRIHIHYGDATKLKNPLVDLVYLDPMFPEDSYQAKVGKGMQVLHKMVAAPTQKEQQQLLDWARCALQPSGKLVVKRPLNAPYLANQQPVQSFDNTAIRFDVYKPVLMMAID